MHHRITLSKATAEDNEAAVTSYVAETMVAQLDDMAFSAAQRAESRQQEAALWGSVAQQVGLAFRMFPAFSGPVLVAARHRIRYRALVSDIVATGSRAAARRAEHALQRAKQAQGAIAATALQLQRRSAHDAHIMHRLSAQLRDARAVSLFLQRRRATLRAAYDQLQVAARTAATSARSASPDLAGEAMASGLDAPATAPGAVNAGTSAPKALSLPPMGAGVAAYNWRDTDEWVIRHTKAGTKLWVHLPTGTSLTKEPTAAPPGYEPGAPNGQGPGAGAAVASPGDAPTAIDTPAPPLPVSPSRFASALTPPASLSSRPALPPPLYLEPSRVYAQHLARAGGGGRSSARVTSRGGAAGSRASTGEPDSDTAASGTRFSDGEGDSKAHLRTRARRRRDRQRAAVGISDDEDSGSDGSSVGSSDTVDSDDVVRLLEDAGAAVRRTRSAPRAGGEPSSGVYTVVRNEMGADAVGDASPAALRRRMRLVKAEYRWCGTEEAAVQQAVLRMEAYLNAASLDRMKRSGREGEQFQRAGRLLEEVAEAEQRRERVEIQLQQVALERAAHKYSQARLREFAAIIGDPTLPSADPAQQRHVRPLLRLRRLPAMVSALQHGVKAMVHGAGLTGGGGGGGGGKGHKRRSSVVAAVQAITTLLAGSRAGAAGARPGRRGSLLAASEAEKHGMEAAAAVMGAKPAQGGRRRSIASPEMVTTAAHCEPTTQWLPVHVAEWRYARWVHAIHERLAEALEGAAGEVESVYREVAARDATDTALEGGDAHGDAALGLTAASAASSLPPPYPDPPNLSHETHALLQLLTSTNLTVPAVARHLSVPMDAVPVDLDGIPTSLPDASRLAQERRVVNAQLGVRGALAGELVGKDLSVVPFSRQAAGSDMVAAAGPTLPRSIDLPSMQLIASLSAPPPDPQFVAVTRSGWMLPRHRAVIAAPTVSNLAFYSIVGDGEEYGNDGFYYWGRDDGIVRGLFGVHILVAPRDDVHLTSVTAGAQQTTPCIGVEADLPAAASAARGLVSQFAAAQKLHWQAWRAWKAAAGGGSGDGGSREVGGAGDAEGGVDTLMATRRQRTGVLRAVEGVEGSRTPAAAPAPAATRRPTAIPAALQPTVARLVPHAPHWWRAVGLGDEDGAMAAAVHSHARERVSLGLAGDGREVTFVRGFGGGVAWATTADAYDLTLAHTEAQLRADILKLAGQAAEAERQLFSVLEAAKESAAQPSDFTLPPIVLRAIRDSITVTDQVHRAHWKAERDRVALEKKAAAGLARARRLARLARRSGATTATSATGEGSGSEGDDAGSTGSGAGASRSEFHVTTAPTDNTPAGDSRDDAASLATDATGGSTATGGSSVVAGKKGFGRRNGTTVDDGSDGSSGGSSSSSDGVPSPARPTPGAAAPRAPDDSHSSDEEGSEGAATSDSGSTATSHTHPSQPPADAKPVALVVDDVTSRDDGELPHPSLHTRVKGRARELRDHTLAALASSARILTPRSQLEAPGTAAAAFAAAVEEVKRRRAEASAASSFAEAADGDAGGATTATGRDRVGKGGGKDGDFESPGFCGIVGADGAVLDWAGDGTQFVLEAWKDRFRLRPWVLNLALMRLLARKGAEWADDVAVAEAALAAAMMQLRLYKVGGTELPAGGFDLIKRRVEQRREEAAAVHAQHMAALAQEEKARLQALAQQGSVVKALRHMRDVMAHLYARATTRGPPMTLAQRLEAMRSGAVAAAYGTQAAARQAYRWTRNAYYTARRAVADARLRRDKTLRYTVAQVKRRQVQTMNLPIGIEDVQFVASNQRDAEFARRQRKRFHAGKSYYLKVDVNVGAPGEPVFVWYRETNDLTRMISRLRWGPLDEDSPDVQEWLHAGYEPLLDDALFPGVGLWMQPNQAHPITDLAVTLDPATEWMQADMGYHKVGAWPSIPPPPPLYPGLDITHNGRGDRGEGGCVVAHHPPHSTPTPPPRVQRAP